MSERIDIGHGMAIKFTTLDRGEGAEPRKVPYVGLLWIHDCAGGENANYIGLDPDYNTPPATWTIESTSPFTLSPSLLCRICQTHGFIREGRWVPA